MRRWLADFLTICNVALTGVTQLLKAAVALFVLIGLIWAIGLVFPFVAQAWGIPQEKPWDFLGASASAAGQIVARVYSTMTAERPRAPTPAISTSPPVAVRATPPPAPTQTSAPT